MPNAIRLHNERVACLSLEHVVWPTGPVCPHCGETSRLGRLKGPSTPVGIWKCYGCRKPFTVRNGTIFHNSHIPMHVWLQAIYVLVATPRKVSSQRLSQILGVSPRAAWQLKQKILNGLDASPLDIGCCAPWHLGAGAIRCAFDDIGNQPGLAVCQARYQRFLAFIEPMATAEADILFIQALYRLLATKPGRVAAADDITEEQLDLLILLEYAPESGADDGGYGRRAGVERSGTHDKG